LRRLVASSQHHNQNAPAPREVQTIARSEINSHLGNLATNRLPITEIACFSKAYSSRDACLPAPIAKGIKPILELLRLEDCEHVAIVSNRIRMVKSAMACPVRPNVRVQPQEPASEAPPVTVGCNPLLCEGPYEPQRDLRCIRSLRPSHEPGGPGSANLSRVTDTAKTIGAFSRAAPRGIMRDATVMLRGPVFGAKHLASGIAIGCVANGDC